MGKAAVVPGRFPWPAEHRGEPLARRPRLPIVGFRRHGSQGASVSIADRGPRGSPRRLRRVAALPQKAERAGRPIGSLRRRCASDPTPRSIDLANRLRAHAAAVSGGRAPRLLDRRGSIDFPVQKRPNNPPRSQRGFPRTVGRTDMPGPSSTSGGPSKTILPGMRCTASTQLPVAFSGRWPPERFRGRRETCGRTHRADSSLPGDGGHGVPGDGDCARQASNGIR